MSPKTIIVTSLRSRSARKRLVIVPQDEAISVGHINKSKHNLVVMRDLSLLGHTDWLTITAYYAMYHSALAILSMAGLSSKNHAATIAVLEHFFSENIDKDILSKFNKLGSKISIEEKYLDYFIWTKSEREKVQYGTDISEDDTGTIMLNATQFVTKAQEVAELTDPKIFSLINQELKRMALG